MEISRTSRRQLRLQAMAFAVLFLTVAGLLAWLSTRYHFQADWTATGRHTLSEASTALLKTIEGPVVVTAFARDSELDPTRKRISELIGRYQLHKKDIRLEFVNPDLAPDKVREYGVTLEGELVIEYQGRRENLQTLSEEALTNTLQRLVRSGERRVLFLQGHGERNPQGQANHDLSTWVRQLENKGFRIGTLNLAVTPAIPDDTAVLVIASPQADLLPGEVDLLGGYVDKGGNLLWMVEPGSLHGLEPLASALGLGFQPGTVVDPTTQLLGIGHPAFAVVADYPGHPITENLATLTLFPLARGIVSKPPVGWEARPLLRTVPRSWAETGPLTGALAFDEGKDIGGPITLGVALTRPRPGARGDAAKDEPGDKEPPQQRVVVLGDGDFLSNTYLGNGANLDLGNRMVNWLSHDDSFIAIPVKTATDTRLQLGPTLSVVLSLGFLVVLPLALLAGGVAIWLKRRKR